MKFKVCAILAMISWTCYAQDLATADAKFRQRNDLQMLLGARAEYKAILDKGLKDSEYLEAADQYLRTVVFEASHFNKDSKNALRSRQIYLNCTNYTDAFLAPSVIGFEYVSYYYFKSRCIIGAMKNSTEIEYLNLLAQIQSTLNKGLETQGSEYFEGGGLLRIRAALKSDPKARGIPGGTYNPENSLQLIDLALNAEAYPGSMQGSLYLENYVEKIRILQRLRSDTGSASFSARASKLAIDSIFDFNDYLQDELIGDQLIFETQDALESIGSLEPEAMSKWKTKMALQKELLEDLVTNTEARDAYDALTILGPAFQAYDKVVSAIGSDLSSLAGIAGAVEVLQECQQGQEDDPLCETILEGLVASQLTTAKQKEKLRNLKDLLDKLPANVPATCGNAASDECVKIYLKTYLTADDIKVLENARKTLDVIRNAPDLFKKYAAKVKEIEEQIEATKHP